MSERDTACRCLSVIIPCYNEADTISEILRRVLRSPHVAEVIVVDDRSTDNSAALASASGDERVRVLVQSEQQGKGAALRRGFREATAEYVLIQDADLEYSPDDYGKLLRPLLDNRADVVLGSRFLSGDARRVLYFWHYIGNRILTTASNIATNLNLSDMETCYKVFRRDLLQGLTLEQDKFGIEPEIVAKVARTDCRVYEVGISYAGRTYAEGKKIGWRDAVEALHCIIRYSAVGERIWAHNSSFSPGRYRLSILPKRVRKDGEPKADREGRTMVSPGHGAVTADGVRPNDAGSERQGVEHRNGMVILGVERPRHE